MNTLIFQNHVDFQFSPKILEYEQRMLDMFLYRTQEFSGWLNSFTVIALNIFENGIFKNVRKL